MKRLVVFLHLFVTCILLGATLRHECPRIIAADYSKRNADALRQTLLRAVQMFGQYEGFTQAPYPWSNGNAPEDLDTFEQILLFEGYSADIEKLGRRIEAERNAYIELSKFLKDSHKFINIQLEESNGFDGEETENLVTMLRAINRSQNAIFELLDDADDLSEAEHWHLVSRQSLILNAFEYTRAFIMGLTSARAGNVDQAREILSRGQLEED